MPVAYAPSAGHTAESAGTVAVGDRTLDVTAALREGDGHLVVPDHDTLLQVVLDEHPALKRVPVSRAGEDAPVVDQFEDMTASQLRDIARSELGIESPPRSRDDLLAAVRAAASNDHEEQ